MSKVNPLVFKNRFNIEFLPTETLLGFKTVNCEVLCDDDKYRWVNGLEIGLIFLTLSFVNIRL
jgi:hypothetical protein|tara:strand:- start:225 stop:413 length:189 start_codon:yes stop_codon:yes gene_type:complete|eukprot:COSAG06_NODE_2_length_50023_cov_292.698041_5_plen_63_part_00